MDSHAELKKECFLDLYLLQCLSLLDEATNRAITFNIVKDFCWVPVFRNSLGSVFLCLALSTSWTKLFTQLMLPLPSVIGSNVSIFHGQSHWQKFYHCSFLSHWKCFWVFLCLRLFSKAPAKSPDGRSYCVNPDSC